MKFDQDDFDRWACRKAQEAAWHAIDNGISVQDVRDAAVLRDQIEREIGQQ